MKDISYHMLDIVQNSLNAGATSIFIELTEDSAGGILRFRITDNGKGMPEDVLQRVTDPFYTTSVTKKVGLGLPLLCQNAEQTGGEFRMHSDMNTGTSVEAMFNTGHIDMIPFGDIAMTVRILTAANPDIDLKLRIVKDGEGFEIDTAVVRKELDNIRLNSKEVLDYLCDCIRNNLEMLSV